MLESEAFDDEAFVNEGACRVCKDVTEVEIAGQFCTPALATSGNSMCTITIAVHNYYRPSFHGRQKRYWLVF